MAAQVAAAIPHSMVVAAGHHLPAPVLCDPSLELSSNILVCSDYPEAARRTGELLEAIPGVRCLYVGSLAQAGSLESLTAALINLNIRYGGEATITIEGLSKK
jgi:predicted dinucleotide-binding enzyme